jgi:hypothetical protein
MLHGCAQYRGVICCLAVVVDGSLQAGNILAIRGQGYEAVELGCCCLKYAAACSMQTGCCIALPTRRKLHLPHVQPVPGASNMAGFIMLQTEAVCGESQAPFCCQPACLADCCHGGILECVAALCTENGSWCTNTLTIMYDSACLPACLPTWLLRAGGHPCTRGALHRGAADRPGEVNSRAALRDSIDETFSNSGTCQLVIVWPLHLLAQRNQCHQVVLCSASNCKWAL